MDLVVLKVDSVHFFQLNDESCCLQKPFLHLYGSNFTFAMASGAMARLHKAARLASRFTRSPPHTRSVHTRSQLVNLARGGSNLVLGNVNGLDCTIVLLKQLALVGRPSIQLKSGIFPNHCMVAWSARSFASGNYPPHQPIGMPSLSPTMTQGNIATWRKKEGDQVAAGDVLCEIETDKATLEMESMEEGYIAKILLPDGAKDIKVGETIAIMVENKDDIAAFKDFQSAPAAAPAAPKAAVTPKEAVPDKKDTQPATAPAPKKEEPKATPAPSDGRPLASPNARKLAEESNLSLASIKGTGPQGRILRADVEDALAAGSHAKAAPSLPSIESVDYTDISNTQIRRVTAQRLLLSKQTIPHYYLSVDVRVDGLLKARSELNELLKKSEGRKLSINDFIIKAASLALQKVPQCNSSWNDDFIRQYRNVNISVAVQTDQGLMVPVVKDANKKGLAAISDDIKVLAEKAKKNSLKPTDYEGGTFTVTNLGGPFGIKQFCAIINPPQSCILAVGTTEKRVIPGEINGEFSSGTFMTVTLSCDHRVVDGAVGAQWLGAFKGYLEDPLTLLL